MTPSGSLRVLCLITGFLHSQQKVTDYPPWGFFFFFSFQSVVTKSPDRTYIVCSEITCKHASMAKTSVLANESLTQDHLQPPHPTCPHQILFLKLLSHTAPTSQNILTIRKVYLCFFLAHWALAYPFQSPSMSHYDERKVSRQCTTFIGSMTSFITSELADVEW